MLNWKQLGLSMIPFLLGLCVGAALTKNKLIWLMIIIYIIISIGSSLLTDKIFKLKNSVDKKVAMKEMGAEIAGNTKDYIYQGHTMGFDLFDKWFPNVSMLIGVGMVIFTIYLIIITSYFNAYLSFFMILIYIMLINIYRNTKRLDTNV